MGTRKTKYYRWILRNEGTKHASMFDFKVEGWRISGENLFLSQLIVSIENWINPNHLETRNS